MTRADDEPYVFAIPQFGQTSKWLERVAQEAPPFFATNPGPFAVSAPGEPSSVASDEPIPGLLNFKPIAPDKDGFFKLPPLGLAESAPGTAEPAPRPAADDSSEAEATGSDAWIGTEEPPTKPVGFRTWDSFRTGGLAPHRPLLISEAGPTAYDALLRRTTGPPGLSNSDVSVVETRAYFSSLLALALGRDSVFFRKADHPQTFKPTLAKIRISGYSRQLLQGVESQTLRCGMSFSQLSAFVRTTYATKSTRCEVALASSIDQILQAVERKLTVTGTRPRSLLQLQSSIRAVSAMLLPLRKLVLRLRRGALDEDVLSLLFHTASALDDGEGCIRFAFRQILRRVSAPWIEHLEEWIGTRQEEGIPLSKTHIGEGRGFVKVEAESYVDDLGRQVEEVDFRLDRSRVPDFMPDDLIDSIFETGRNLRFIKSFHPEHPLAQQCVVESSQPPKAQWLYDWDSILELEGRVSRYRDSLCDALEESRRSSSPRACRVGVPAPEPEPTSPLGFFGLDEKDMEACMLASMAQLSRPMTEQESKDPEDDVLRRRLFDSHGPDSEDAGATPHWSLLPVLSFGGIASAQGQIVSRESLRLLFDAHDIGKHLRLQRDFHLLGNGMFSSRLAQALFDPDLHSAERVAGTVRQGGVMGLRLGGRDSWPPASSELRLVLMGVLSDSYGSQQESGRTERPARDGDGVALPGDLSFAVRDLSTEEIDKCMNPDSLEALDFLRLSYTTPPELCGIITPINMTHYDRIFKLLLRVLRMLHVVNQHCLGINSRAGTWQSPSSASYLFAREAHRFVSSVASYFFDSGIAVPWQTFEQGLAEMRAALGDGRGGGPPEELPGPDKLRELHSRVLDRIMYALFLKKRQRPVLQLLEDLFGTVLEYAKFARGQASGTGGERAEGHDRASELYGDFKRKMHVFMAVCRGLTEKGRAGSGRAVEELGVGEDSMVAQLLVKLDMGSFYTKR
ncbi:hypothetical protein CDD83_2615 [Cordyceps sp. RAO-2017]|nr:hypothetical protein CDD83_2615 [Cordyceps sp. RAO-2017]